MMNNKKIMIYLLSIVAVLYGCSLNSENKKVDSNEFEFTFIGKVSNGEGLIVELSYPEIFDRPLQAKIEGGKFKISGTTDRVRQAEIRIKNSRSFGNVIIEPGLNSFKFNIQGNSPDYRFSLPEILEGSNNKFWFDFNMELMKEIGNRAWVFGGDSIKMDSMRKFVYPDIRNQVFNLYERKYKAAPPELKMALFGLFTEKLNREGFLNKNYLNETEISAIKNYFSEIDTSYNKYPEYLKAQATILMIEDLGLERKFHDYQVEDINGDLVTLSEILKDNKYTILDFWWHGCQPCRKFNREMNLDYVKLKKYGIEILAINIDRSKKDWKTASNMDKIPWRNLFAGSNTDIGLKYKINAFPKYIVFDDKLSIINVNIKGKADIFNWIENVNSQRK